MRFQRIAKRVQDFRYRLIFRNETIKHKNRNMFFSCARWSKWNLIYLNILAMKFQFRFIRLDWLLSDILDYCINIYYEEIHIIYSNRQRNQFHFHGRTENKNIAVHAQTHILFQFTSIIFLTRCPWIIKQTSTIKKWAIACS